MINFTFCNVKLKRRVMQMRQSMKEVKRKILLNLCSISCSCQLLVWALTCPEVWHPSSSSSCYWHVWPNLPPPPLGAATGKGSLQGPFTAVTSTQNHGGVSPSEAPADQCRRAEKMSFFFKSILICRRTVSFHGKHGIRCGRCYDPPSKVFFFTLMES